MKKLDIIEMLTAERLPRSFRLPHKLMAAFEKNAEINQRVSISDHLIVVIVDYLNKEAKHD